MAGTEQLERYLEQARIVREMRALAQRYAAATKKDCAVSITLQVTIDGVAITPLDLAPINRALSERVRAGLPQLLQAAIAVQEAALAAEKASAKAEYDALFV
jgi:hypothetical protein